MTVRALIAFILVAAAAVTLALLVRVNTGYVLFVAPPYRVELWRCASFSYGKGAMSSENSLTIGAACVNGPGR